MERARGGRTTPLGELIVDEPFLRRPSGTQTEEGLAHLRVLDDRDCPISRSSSIRSAWSPK